MINVYEQIDSNKRKSTIIMLAFILFISLAAWILSEALGYGLYGAAFALILSGLMSLGSYYAGDKIILTLSRARQADRKRDFNFYTVTENLAMAAQVPPPKLYVIDDTAPNAFATGRDPKHAVVCATTGLLQKLDRSELEGVIAHELSHIKHYDIRLMSIVTVLVGVITLLADWFLRMSWRGGRDRNREEKGNIGAIIALIAIVLALLSPIIAQLIQLTISKRREFYADAGSALLTRYPEGLIRALEKISQDREPLEAANKATAHLYIINPFKLDSKGVYPERSRGAIGWFANLFNTHPPIQERIKTLQGMM